MYAELLANFEQLAELVSEEELEVIAADMLNGLEKVADSAMESIEKLG